MSEQQQYNNGKEQKKKKKNGAAKNNKNKIMVMAISGIYRFIKKAYKTSTIIIKWNGSE